MVRRCALHTRRFAVLSALPIRPAFGKVRRQAAAFVRVWAEAARAAKGARIREADSAPPKKKAARIREAGSAGAKKKTCAGRADKSRNYE